jgi:hypothetical protein
MEDWVDPRADPDAVEKKILSQLARFKPRFLGRSARSLVAILIYASLGSRSKYVTPSTFHAIYNIYNFGTYMTSLWSAHLILCIKKLE